MCNALQLHVLHRVEHLVGEETPNVLSHSPVGLAHVKKESAFDELHHQVDQVLQSAATGLNDESLVAKVYQAHNIFVRNTAQNLYFVSEGLKVVLGALYKVLLQNLDGDFCGLDSWVNCEPQVHF